MAVLVWDDAGNRFYETGISKGVLYPIDASGDYPLGHAWNGIVSVSESPSGAETTKLWADNINYLNLISAEEFALTLDAYTYPVEFGPCDGSVESETGVFISQQPRTKFGLAYRTEVGNDVDGQAHGYLLHLVYGCQAAPSERAYNSINDSPEAITFSWEITSTPALVTGEQPTSLIVIDSRTADPTDLAAFLLVLFGDAATDPELPDPDAVIAAFTP